MSTTTTGAMATPSSQPMPDLPGYLDLLITRLATHGSTCAEPGNPRNAEHAGRIAAYGGAGRKP